MKFKNRLIIVFILTLIPLTGFSSTEYLFPQPPDTISASYEGGPFSMVLNPVFSDTSGKSFFAYRYFAYNEGDKANHFLGFSLFGLSFMYSRYNEIYRSDTDIHSDSSSDLYYINKGFFLANTFGFGAGYTFSRSNNKDYDDYKAFNAGFLLRPSQYISFGFTMQDIKGEYSGGDINRRDTYSISIRPYFQNITLSMDGSKLSSEKFTDMAYSFSGNIKFPNDIELTGKVDTDKNLQFALSIPLFFRTRYPSSMVIDGYASSFKNSKADYSSAGISYSIARNTKAKEFHGTHNLLHIKFDRPIKEVERPSFFAERSPVFTELLSAIINAGDDRTMEGLLIEIDRVNFGMAQIQEIREEILKVKLRGKKVYAVLNYPGNKEYYMASAADKIYFTPNTPFYLTGLSAQIYFFKGILDKAGIEFESVRFGKYKSLNEPLTRESISPEFR